MKQTLCLALLAAVPAGHAAAACNLDQLSLINPSVVLNYDPFDADGSLERLNVRVQPARSEACRDAAFKLSVEPETGLALGGDDVLLTNGTDQATVRFLDRNGRSRLNRSLDTNIQRVRFTGFGSRLNDDIAVEVPANQNLSPGDFKARLVLVAEVIEDGEASGAVSRVPFDVILRVRPSFRLAAGSGTTVDFGEIRPGGVSNTVRFSAYSNVDYDVVVESENDFAIRRGRLGEGIPYTVQISERPLVVESRRTGALRFGKGDRGRTVHRLNAQITGDADGPAGDYKDTLTVTLRARVGS